MELRHVSIRVSFRERAVYSGGLHGHHETWPKVHSGSIVTMMEVCTDRPQLCKIIYCCISSDVYSYAVAAQFSSGEFGVIWLCSSAEIVCVRAEPGAPRIPQ